MGGFWHEFWDCRGAIGDGDNIATTGLDGSVMVGVGIANHQGFFQDGSQGGRKYGETRRLQAFAPTPLSAVITISMNALMPRSSRLILVVSSPSLVRVARRYPSSARLRMT